MKFVPDQCKTQEVCDDTLGRRSNSMHYNSDWFVMQRLVEMWHDGDYCNNNGLVDWCSGYKQHKAWKKVIERQLIPIAWFPCQYWNCSVPKGEKKVKSVER